VGARSFALIGGAGYVAPRHMRGIAAVGEDLRAIIHPTDSVGIDMHIPDAALFADFERFCDRRSKSSRSFATGHSDSGLHSFVNRYLAMAGEICDALCRLRQFVRRVAKIETLTQKERLNCETTRHRRERKYCVAAILAVVEVRPQFINVAFVSRALAPGWRGICPPSRGSGSFSLEIPFVSVRECHRISRG